MFDDSDNGNANRSSYKKYPKENMEYAIDAVINGNMTALQAAYKFKVPPRTLYDRVKREKTTTTIKSYNDESVSSSIPSQYHQIHVKSEVFEDSNSSSSEEEANLMKMKEGRPFKMEFSFDPNFPEPNGMKVEETGRHERFTDLFDLVHGEWTRVENDIDTIFQGTFIDLGFDPLCQDELTNLLR